MLSKQRLSYASVLLTFTHVLLLHGLCPVTLRQKAGRFTGRAFKVNEFSGSRSVSPQIFKQVLPYLTANGGYDSNGWKRPNLNRIKEFESSVGTLINKQYMLKEVAQPDLKEAATLCINVFFPAVIKESADSLLAISPLKQMQQQQLWEEQLNDLASRCACSEQNAMFQVLDIASGKMIGFVEICALPGYKFGMGEGVEARDFRPVLSNLAIDSNFRRKGIGQALEQECAKVARSWGYDEIILQVEETNTGAREFYCKMGYTELFTDHAARRYDTSGIFLRNIQTSKICMRRPLGKSSTYNQIHGMFNWKDLLKLLGS